MVNKDGYAYAYYPQRKNHLVVTNKTWAQMVAESKQRKQVIRLNEAGMKEIVEDCLIKMLGWEIIKRERTAATPHELKLLKKSYDKYAEECVSRGDIPNSYGFTVWCDEKCIKAGGKNLYPQYV